MQTPASPGLTKVRAVPLVQRRRVELCTAHEGRWREILDAADVMSEGKTRPEGAGFVYYGSTSVLLPRRSSGGHLPDPDVPSLAGILRLDPHIRLRALRIAHREAELRAGAPMRTLHAEIQISDAPRGVIITIEVTAHLHRPSLRNTTPLPPPAPAVTR